MCVMTSSWPAPMRLRSCQCAPSSLEVNTWPSEVPRYSLFTSRGSAPKEMTVPPGGPACLHVGAVVEAAVSAIAASPIHFAFIRMHSPRAQRRPQDAIVRNPLLKRACSEGQIWGHLFIVLVRATLWSRCANLATTSFPLWGSMVWEL